MSAITTLRRLLSAGEKPPTAAQLSQASQEVHEQLERDRAALKQLQSSRRQVLVAGEPEDLERHGRETERLERAIEVGEARADELTRRRRKAVEEERVTEMPARVQRATTAAAELEEADRRLQEARAKCEEAVTDLVSAWSFVEVRRPERLYDLPAIPRELGPIVRKHLGDHIRLPVRPERPDPDARVAVMTGDGTFELQGNWTPQQKEELHRLHGPRAVRPASAVERFIKGE